MPGWHEATKKLQEASKVQMVGIIQEQHPDRCRLFMQWKQMGWPILVDSLNLLQVSAVPITLTIDEHGIIRGKGLRVDAGDTIEQTFLDKTFETPSGLSDPPPSEAPDLGELQQRAAEGGVSSLREYAASLVMWAGPERLGEAIEAYRQAVTLEPRNGLTHFGLGVAYRKRYDSDHRRSGDFSSAVKHWKTALDIDPNQYIWRRRIQQYGPRLDKPYPFYDWVHVARKEVRARGEEPHPLVVEPGGAEFAHPREEFEAITEEKGEPDPEGRIYRDQEEFVLVEKTVVPPVIAPGETARVHVAFFPNVEKKAHWNNEVDDLEYWVEPPEGWDVDQQLLSTPNPPQTVSQETRKIEFELRCPDDAEPGEATLSSYALYYVCEDINGVCLYRRQDVEIPIEVRRSSP